MWWSKRALLPFSPRAGRRWPSAARADEGPREAPGPSSLCAPADWRARGPSSGPSGHLLPAGGEKGFALLLALGLGGCFQPLYGEASHPGLVDDMRAIQVLPIKDRIGHYLGDNLITDMNGSGATPPAKYKLEVTLATSTQTPTIESQINAASAATSIADATFVLTRLDDAKVVTRGVANASAVYDRTPQRFANLRAARDADIRLARDLASEIELRIAAALGEGK